MVGNVENCGFNKDRVFRYIVEGIDFAIAKRNPMILPKSLNLAFRHVNRLPFIMVVDRHNHTGGNGALGQAVGALAVRKRG